MLDLQLRQHTPAHVVNSYASVREHPLLATAMVFVTADYGVHTDVLYRIAPCAQG